MTVDELRRTQALLRLAQQHAHRTDEERAEMEALLRTEQADSARAHARAARAYAEGVTAQAAITEVRRLCDLTIEASARVQAVQQARDTLAVIDNIVGDGPVPGDEGWHSVWLHGNWRFLTKHMPTPEKEHAADAVARYSRHLEPDEPDLDGLRWWREASR